MQIQAEFEPREVDGQLTVLIDGQRYGAFVDGDQLIVRGVQFAGCVLPKWRPGCGFLIRLDSSASLTLRLDQQFSAPDDETPHMSELALG